jgi:hypothetical protein
VNAPLTAGRLALASAFKSAGIVLPLGFADDDNAQHMLLAGT